MHQRSEEGIGSTGVKCSREPIGFQEPRFSARAVTTFHHPSHLLSPPHLGFIQPMPACLGIVLPTVVWPGPRWSEPTPRIHQPRLFLTGFPTDLSADGNSLIAVLPSQVALCHVKLTKTNQVRASGDEIQVHTWLDVLAGNLSFSPSPSWEFRSLMAPPCLLCRFASTDLCLFERPWFHNGLLLPAYDLSAQLPTASLPKSPPNTPSAENRIGFLVSHL